MIEVSVTDCSVGDIVANEIINRNGLTLLAKNTVINSYIKERLSIMGLDKITIFSNNHALSDENIKVTNTYRDTIILMKETLQNISSGKQLEIQKIKEQTDSIFDINNNPGCILKCIQELRGSDEYTYMHCVETSFYGLLIAKWLGLSSEEMRKTIQSGLLHDIGKAKVPLEILNKSGIITKAEYELVKNHTLYGYEMLCELREEVDTDVKQAVLLHHERLDRSGYPLQACAEEINQYAKIIAVADVFGAMTTDRVYKKRSSPFEAFEMFLTVGLSLFDTTIINTFIKNIAPYYIGAKVLLNNEEIGQIVYIPPHDVIHPIVQSGDKFYDLSGNSKIKIQYLI